MPTQQYLWLAALSMVALRLQHNKNNDDSPDTPKSSLTDVTGIAGRLCHHNSPAANDLSAALLVLILVLWQLCAIYSAKFVICGPVFCELTRRQFFAALTLCALKLLAYVLSVILHPAVPKRSPPHTTPATPACR